MSIAALPTPPSPTDSVVDFDTKAFAFLASLQTFCAEANAQANEIQANADITASLALGMALPNYGGTSTTSLTVGTGACSFVTQAGKSWAAGQIVVASNGANFMKGTVTAYAGTTLGVNVTSIGGSGTLASWTIGLSYAGLVLAAAGNNNDITSLGALAAVPSVVSAALNSSRVFVRQTVASGAVDANGQANFLAIGTGLAVNLAATTVPVSYNFAAGYGANGAIDYVGRDTEDIASAWSSLTASSTLFLYRDRNTSTGALTAGFSALLPVYQTTAPAAPATDRHWFDTTTFIMKRWSGSAWVVVQRVFLGECVTGASTVTSVTTYALMGRYYNEQVSLTLSTAYNFSHNIGASLLHVSRWFECKTAEVGYSIGDRIYESSGDSNGTSHNGGPFWTTYKTCGMTLGAGSGISILQVAQKSTGAVASLTPANWKFGFSAIRGF